jgi:serine/threonine protein kinase
MGVVFKARDPLIGRSVALKTITAGVAEDPELLARFYREAKSAGALHHPNIVTIYELSESEGLPFIAMEYLEGESLGQVIVRRLPLPLAQKLGYMVQACRAFDYAHQRGVVHRDIKPANIMITIEGVVKVVDFGIARIVDTSRTQTGSLLGTLSYMSPEQLRGQPADERCDIWSLGAVLYESIGYGKPFTGDNHGALLRSILEDEPQSIQEVAPECPANLKKVVDRALCKDRSDRFQTVEQLLVELEPIWSELQQDTVQQLVDSGRKLIAEGETDEACRLLRQAVVVNSKNVTAKALLDELHASPSGNQGAELVREIVARSEKLLEEGLFFDARVEVQSALKLAPRDPEALRLQQQVQSQEARAHEDNRQKAPIGLRSTDQESPKTELIPAAELLFSTTSSRRWKRTALYLACGAVVLAGLGVGAYRRHSLSRRALLPTQSSNPSGPLLPQAPVDAPPPAASAPGLDPVVAPAAPLPAAPLAATSRPAGGIEDQQRRLIDLADAAADASNYKAAEDRLDEAARLDGPLNTTIADLRRQFSEQARSAQTQRATQEERSRWDRAMKHMQSGELDDAEKLLREIIALPGTVHRRSDAERYVDQIIPQRRQEELLWADLQQYSRSVSADHRLNEVKTLDKLLILGSDRQQEARQLREGLIARLAQANAIKNRKPLPVVSASDRERIAALQTRFDRAVQQGNVEGLQQLHALRPQFKALTGREGLLALDARDYLNNLVPRAEKQIQTNLATADSHAAANAEYETLVKRYDQEVAAQDLSVLRSRTLVEFRQIVSSGGLRASEAAQYVNILIPQALKGRSGEGKYYGLSQTQPDAADQ